MATVTGQYSIAVKSESPFGPSGNGNYALIVRAGGGYRPLSVELDDAVATW
jgi:hypothetical protein